MVGNVKEWVWDRYGEYPSGAASNPPGPESGSYCVSRGGSWSLFEEYCCAAYRGRFVPSRRDLDIGFRCARTP